MRISRTRAMTAMAATVLAGAAMTASATVPASASAAAPRGSVSHQATQASGPVVRSPQQAVRAASAEHGTNLRHGGFLPGYVLIDCAHQPVVMPYRFILACADAGDYLSVLHWATWAKTALGAGVEWINDCNPTCASGHFHRYLALVVLWRARRLGKLHHYTRMTIVYPNREPVFDGTHVRFRTIRLWR